VFISGFGQSLAQHLSKQGVAVFAGCLDATGEGAMTLKQADCPHLHVLQMDVTNDEQVEDCVKYVRETTGGLGKTKIVIL